MKLYNINCKSYNDLRSLRKIQNQLDEPEWISYENRLNYI